MKLNREKIAELYQQFLEENDTEGRLSTITSDVLDVVCFIIERNPNTIDIHPDYTTSVSWFKIKE